MNKKAIRWLYEQLPTLTSKNILTQDAAQKIQQYYGDVKSTNKTPIALIIFGVIGALLIGLGVILLFGHNWDQLSRSVRAALSLLPLIAAQGLGVWVLLKKPESHALRESVAIFLTLMVGASIALISQTYHIPGDAGTFILTWICLIFPIIYLFGSSISAVIFLIGAAVWSGSHWDNHAKMILFWPMAAAIIPHFVWAIRQKIYTIRTSILSFIIIICFNIFATASLGRTWANSWFIIMPSLYAVFYSLGAWKFKGLTTSWQKPLRFLGGLGIFGYALSLTFRYAWEFLLDRSSYVQGDMASFAAIPDHVITLTIIGGALLFLIGNVWRKNHINALFGLLPILTIVFYFSPSQSVFFPLLVFNVYLLTLSISLIARGLRGNSLSAINIGMLMLATVIISRFFDSNINFIFKGLAFIAVGIAFLVVNIYLVRKRGGER